LAKAKAAASNSASSTTAVRFMSPPRGALYGVDPPATAQGPAASNVLGLIQARFSGLRTGPKALINTLISKVIGTKNEREVKRIQPLVERIGALEAELERLSDAELRAKTEGFRKRIADRLAALPDEPDADADRQPQLQKERELALKEVLDDLLPEAF